MYRVKIINNNTETIIHEPVADREAPHLLNLQLKETLSLAEQLNFDIPFGNIGYNLITPLVSKIKIIDTRDNSTVFIGRVLNPKDGMDNDGKFINNIECEGAINYLNDSNTRRWHFGDQTPTQILQYLLDQHNSKADDSRKIQLGTIQLTQHITVDTNYESTLNAIITKMHNILGGDFRVRETNGVLYLDYLFAQGTDSNTIFKIGANLKQIIREYDSTDVVTRLIPLGYGEGINQLDITSVNNNVEYIDDANAINTYGLIEGVATNKDIQNANTLLIYGQNVLNEKKQPKLIIDTSAIDRSVLSAYATEKYNLGDTIRVLVDFIGIDVLARVIERERDLINSPWDPKLTISTRPISLSDQLIDLKQRNMNLENCPQGCTYIDTYGYAENIDENHSFHLPIWLSPDILYVNRVRLHIDSQKYRAYEKGMADAGDVTTSSGASSKATSDSGGGSTQTSSSGGGSTQTSSSGGGGTQTSSSGGGSTQTSSSGGGINATSGVAAGYVSNNWYFNSSIAKYVLGLNGQYIIQEDLAHSHNVTVSDHTHSVSIPNHTHSVSIPDHTHSVSIPDHTHSVEIPSHSHGMEHTHEITIPSHTHEIEYGIFEDTYPADVAVKINGTTIPNINLSEGGTVDTDISYYVGNPGSTYDLEVTSSRNGRVNVWVSIQAFIQIK